MRTNVFAFHRQLRILGGGLAVALAWGCTSDAPATVDTMGGTGGGDSSTTEETAMVSTATMPDSLSTSGPDATSVGSSTSTGDDPDDGQTPGMALWQWDALEEIEAMAVTEAGDVLVASIDDDGDVLVQRIGGESGEVLEDWTAVTPPVPRDAAEIHADVGAMDALGGEPVLAVGYAVQDDRGTFVDVFSQVERLGSDGWIVAGPGDPRGIDISDAGIFVAGADEVLAFDTTGESRWTRSTRSGTLVGVVARDDGAVVAVGRSRVLLLDDAGEVVEVFDAPSGTTHDLFTGLAHYPPNGVLVLRSVVDDITDLTSIGVLFHLDENLQEVRTLEHTSGGATGMATDSAGNIFLPMIGESITDFGVAKFNPELEHQWTWFDNSTNYVHELAADSSGDVFLRLSRGIVKLAGSPTG